MKRLFVVGTWVWLMCNEVRVANQNAQIIILNWSKHEVCLECPHSHGPGVVQFFMSLSETLD